MAILTDRAWPDDTIERKILEDAGITVIAAGAGPNPVEEIDRLVSDTQPDAILTCWDRISDVAISSAKNLRVITRLGIGLDNIAVSTATSHGVVVTNVPDYCTEEVSDHAVALALAWTRGVAHADREIRAGRWNPSRFQLRRLSTLTCGIIGFGKIGRRTAAKLLGFGAEVLIHSRTPPVGASSVTNVTMNELLSSSDIVFLHVPLTDATQHLISADELRIMRPGAVLINVSRGGLVDTAALLESLNAGHLGGACLDVLEGEPIVPAELLAHDSVIITPHIAFTSDVALSELRRGAAEEVVRVLAGKPAEHPCNSPTPRSNT
ncbi:C-terminal binding protein [Rhodococcus sovatensis]|uniref:C-terminal binding protein n=1 Tax=Rhodococcus sovatensis TaxID=1805840 RepID=A0ABZ2PHZ7_9NOCA